MRHSFEFCASILSVLAIGIHAESFIVPYSGNLYMSAVGGSAGAVSTFGVGTSQSNYTQYLSGLPSNPSPSGDVSIGSVKAGQTVVFGMSTFWNNQTYWAFSNATDQGSIVAFSDVNNTLGMGGKIIQQTGPTTWVMHLNDAAHYTITSSEANNILIQLRLAAAPVAPQPMLGRSASCSQADLLGSYRYALSGFSSSGTLVPFADSGIIQSDGKGNLTGKSTYVNGKTPAVRRTLAGTYTLNSDCTGSVIFIGGPGQIAHLQIVLTNGKADVGFIQTDAGVNIAGTAHAQTGDCTNLNLFGPYSYAISGWVSSPNGFSPFSDLGVITTDQFDNFTGADSAVQNGAYIQRSLTGSLSVGSDCTGSAKFVDSLGDSLNVDLVSANDGHELHFIQTDTGSNLAGDIFRQTASPAFGVVDTTTRNTRPISAGEIVSAIGQGLGPDNFMSSVPDGNGIFPTSLGGAQVMVNGIPAPLVYAQSDEISFIVPPTISISSPVSVQVMNSQGSSNTIQVQTAKASPSIFALSSDGSGQAFIADSLGTLNSAYNPSARGDAISIYGTGGGLTTTVLPAGQVPTQPYGLQQSVQVNIGGVAAQVTYAGVSVGGNPGAMQINVVIPMNAPVGKAVPIQVNVAGIVSQQGLTMAVK
jgi:uncharacterized protein (TIGR03437 family)